MIAATNSSTLGAFAALGLGEYGRARELLAELLELCQQPGMQQSMLSAL